MMFRFDEVWVVFTIMQDQYSGIILFHRVIRYILSTDIYLACTQMLIEMMICKLIHMETTYKWNEYT